MLLKLALLCSMLATSSCFQSQQRTRGYYTIVAPATIRSDSEYQVSISLTEFHQSCWFNITIQTQFKQEVAKTVKVHPGTTNLIQIHTPVLSYGPGILKVSGFRGIVSRNEGQLNIEHLHHTVYIQTDKAKYRPGELMQFRVILIDQNTRPASVKGNLVVQIFDGEMNLVREIPNIVLVQGVFKGDVRISQYPVLGEWLILLTSNRRRVERKTFQVARYDLPDFLVDITTKKDVAVVEGQIVMTVKASYTYGEPVKGDLLIDLRATNDHFGFQNWRPRFSKEIQIDGETTVVFDFKSAPGIPRESRDTFIFCKLTAYGEVKDASTGRYSEAVTQIVVHNHPYRIEVKAPKLFNPGELVSVRDLQGNPIRDSNNTVKVKIEGDDITPIDTHVPKVIELPLNENGVGTASLNLTNEGLEAYTIRAEYLGWLSHLERLERNEDSSFGLNVLTETPEVGKEIIVQLTSVKPLGQYVYEIVSRGDILKAEQIWVPEGDTTYLFHIDTTYSMVPKISLFVHCVQDGIFDSQLREIYVKPELENTIEINTDDEVKPGSLASVNITAAEGSYVGLMAIDKKFLLDPSSPDDLTEDRVYTDLSEYTPWNINSERYPGSEAGLLTFSNSRNRAGSVIGPRRPIVFYDSYPSAEIPVKPFVLPRVRDMFAESWIFKDLERIPEEGWKFNETIPDTITSWAITGFSLNPNTGLALTKAATMLKVFQPFFLSMELPSSVKQGEIFEFPVYVANYLEEELLANVTIASSNADLELLNTDLRSESIPAQGMVNLVYRACARKPGAYNVTVTARSAKASDAIRKALTVTSEGVPYSFSKIYLEHLTDESTKQHDILLDVPENFVHGSAKVQLSVVGDIFGPLMDSLEQLVRVPYGNGEDNIRYFVSNLMVLKYLKALDQSNPSLEARAKLHLQLGYQNLLAFKHLDGSFSFFDRTVGTTGDVWLTAYVMWGLQHAKNFTAVDRKVIDRGFRYLKSKQGENGGFSSGKGVKEDLDLTAFIVLSLLVDERHHGDAIRKSLSYLYDSLDDLEDSVSAVMPKYALILGKHEKSAQLLTKPIAGPADGIHQEIWTNTDNLQSNLEATAASFVNLLEFHSKPLPVVKALLSSRQGDRKHIHMIALEAMIKSVRDLDLGRRDLRINFNDGQGVSGDLHVNNSNAQVRQTVMLSETSRRVHVESKGTGYAVVHIKYTYNVLSDEQSLSNYQTNITVKHSRRSSCLKACLRSLDHDSNHTAVEINLQSGYAFDETGFKNIQDNRKQIRSIDKGSVIVYMESVSKNWTCVQLEVLETFKVFNAKPGSVVVYDIHKEDERSVSFFEMGLGIVESKEERGSGDCF